MNHISMILVSVSLGAIGQILLKAGANKLVDFNLSFQDLFQNLLTIMKIPQLLIGIIFFGLSFLLWIKVLTKAELSYAYPMVSLSYVIVGIGSAVFFNESITINKVLGISAIVAGVFILNR